VPAPALPPRLPAQLTTREVADYLRLKERKIYDLIAERRIPCARVGGKWLFPREAIELWLAASLARESGFAPKAPPPPVVAGSQDPLLDFALKESGADLAFHAGGSLDGVARFADGRAMLAGLHVVDEATGEYNLPLLQARLAGKDAVAVHWAWRSQGLLLGPRAAKKVKGVTDLKGLRVARRQDEAGSAILLRRLLRQASLAEDAIDFTSAIYRSETDLALAVLAGEADAGLAVESAARQLKLAFLPLARECFDLVVGRRDYFEPAIQKLFTFARSKAFAAEAKRLGGYDIAALGEVRWNSP
jgi:excisionase family DNA binding protein